MKGEPELPGFVKATTTLAIDKSRLFSSLSILARLARVYRRLIEKEENDAKAGEKRAREFPGNVSSKLCLVWQLWQSTCKQSTYHKPDFVEPGYLARLLPPKTADRYVGLSRDRRVGRAYPCVRRGNRIPRKEAAS
jgi:hypothetical protein